ncbi:MAG: hypothetical protein KAU14_08820, partial [Thermoplasmata archaeon]|nr:hypothetical protein [Thermoplasmata archaeon]
MTDTNRRIFQFLMATILIVALSMPLFNAPGVEAYETEDLRIINLHPNHDGGGQHFMNTVQENPGDESGTNITWSYGWLEDGDIVDDDLKEGLYIKGTAHEGKIVRVKSLRIHYPSLTGQTQVTMELIDDSKVIADVTETLDGTWLGGESKDDWDLEFREGANSHVFDKGDTLSLRMRSTESVDVDYQSGNARLELYAHQITLVEDIHVEDVNGKDMKGEYFIPKLPDELAIAHIWGIVGDALSYRDVESASITIKDPDGENVVENDSMILTPINDTWVRFDYNWSYSDDMVNENDAGTYDFTVYVHDQNAHDYPYSDSLKMNKYGAYIIEEEGEDLSKSGSAGENVLYRFQVYNAGLIADNINITHDELSGGWEATFDKDSVSPDPGEYDTVTMNVTIPLSAEIKSEKLIVVTVTSESSENDPEYPIAKRSISTTTEVTPVASISVFYTKEDKDG